MESLTRTSVNMDFSGTKHFEFAIGLLKFSAELRNKVRAEMSGFPQNLKYFGALFVLDLTNMFRCRSQPKRKRLFDNFQFHHNPFSCFSLYVLLYLLQVNLMWSLKEYLICWNSFPRLCTKKLLLQNQSCIFHKRVLETTNWKQQGGGGKIKQRRRETICRLKNAKRGRKKISEMQKSCWRTNKLFFNLLFIAGY